MAHSPQSPNKNKHDRRTVEVPIHGMDCAECTRHVQRAIADLPGVETVDVLLGAEKALVRMDVNQVDLDDIRIAVKRAGYDMPQDPHGSSRYSLSEGYSRRILQLLGMIFLALILVVVVGEWLGLLEAMSTRIPWPVGLAIILLAGLPVFRNVLQAMLQRRIIAHTLMTVGVLAALAVGEWATAAVVVVFMRVGDYVERFTAERARRAIGDLAALAPQTARIERQGLEVEVAIEQVKEGDIVIVRPGEIIPVDGEVVSGQAAINQATITGEALPVDVHPGSAVYAATITTLGSIRIRSVHVGPDSTFGRVIRMVEQAEAQRGELQRAADRFSTAFLPIVAGIAALTFLLRGDPLATAAVLVVACSCSFALATPIAMLASIGASAKRGILIKGGKHLEALAQADIVLIDKTGTLTLGQPQLTDILPAADIGSDTLLRLAASAERYSEHPLAEAVRRAAFERGLSLEEAHQFEAIPGMGVRAMVAGEIVTVGKQQMAAVKSTAIHLDEHSLKDKTLLYVTQNDALLGVLAVADTLRTEVPAAMESLKKLELEKIELLTGDSQRVAGPLAQALGIPFQAELLPEDKIHIVQAYQAQGKVVVMVGDGVNDAPALAQADIGIAMGAAGSDVAIEAAHIALLREDWMLIPEVFRVARRTLKIVKMNIGFTLLYNLIGITLASAGILPPVLAAAAQSIPDLGILANSSRLLYQE